MRKISLVVFALGFVLTAALPGAGQGCRVELVSMHRLSLPVSIEAGVGPLHLAVDERGTMYVGFSSWQRESGGRVVSSPPQIVSYDANGQMVRVFEKPVVIADRAQWVQLTSLVYAQGRIYATVQWHAEQWQGALFLFGTSGELQRTVMLDALENPRLLVIGSNLGVIGTVRNRWGRETKEIGLLYIFSLDGQKLAERVLSEESVGEPREAHVLSDGAGRLLLVEAKGEVETLMPSRQYWLKVPWGFDHIHAVFPTDDAIAINRVDPATRRLSLLLVDERGERCVVETTGRLSPMVRGADGFFYGFGQVGVSATPSTDRRRILIGRFRIASSSHAR
jgi:hypothetical protein